MRIQSLGFFYRAGRRKGNEIGDFELRDGRSSSASGDKKKKKMVHGIILAVDRKRNVE